VGDYVVYRTVQLRNGKEETIHLLERVDEKHCRRIVLHDWLVRADERREWKMFLTDTPQNQANNVADGVTERTPTGWVTLKNQANADLRRLFDTGVDVDGPTELVSKRELSCRVAKRSYSCTTKTTRGAVQGVPVIITCRTSSDFLWTNLGCEFVRMVDGKQIFRMEILDVGRVRPDALPESWSRALRRGHVAPAASRATSCVSRRTRSGRAPSGR
jgi:hypothetical protein